MTQVAAMTIFRGILYASNMELNATRLELSALTSQALQLFSSCARRTRSAMESAKWTQHTHSAVAAAPSYFTGFRAWILKPGPKSVFEQGIAGANVGSIFTRTCPSSWLPNAAPMRPCEYLPENFLAVVTRLRVWRTIGSAFSVNDAPPGLIRHATFFWA